MQSGSAFRFLGGRFGENTSLILPWLPIPNRRLLGLVQSDFLCAQLALQLADLVRRKVCTQMLRLVAETAVFGHCLVKSTSQFIVSAPQKIAFVADVHRRVRNFGLPIPDDVLEHFAAPTEL